MFDFERQRLATAFFRAVDSRSLVLGQPTRGASGVSDGALAGLFVGPGAANANTHGATGTNHGSASLSRAAKVIARHEFNRSNSGFNEPAEKQGTLMGVYLPVATSMWGVLIFIRFGVIAGYSGWVLALCFAFLSIFVQTLTTLSLCTVISNSTNYKGGSFGILKRNLGGELAGVVCILYYLGMTTLASIELLGSVQSLTFLIGTLTGHDSLTGSRYWDQVALGGPLLVVLAGVRAVDVRFVHSITALILVAVLASFIFGFIGLFLTAGDWRGTQSGIPGVTGLNLTTFRNNAMPDWSLPTLFSEKELGEYFGTDQATVASSRVSSPAATLALLFPCFLGVLNGGNKAPDLRTPNQSIFRGTFGALGTSLTIYVLLFLLLCAVAERDVLKSEPLLFANLVWPSEYLGLIGTVLVGLGACVSLLEIGPTVLHAVAEDGLYSFLRRLGLHQRTSRGEPANAVLVSFTLNFCLLFVSTAYFEALAGVVTMFFLQAYSHMHLALLLNEVQQHSSWRPVFRFYHWSSAALGFTATLTLMFLISYVQALVTISIAAVLMLMVKIIEEPRRKGLGTRALGQGRALNFLLTDDNITHRELLQNDNEGAGENDLAITVDQDSFWEPQVLCLIEDPDAPPFDQTNLKLLHLTEQLSSRGLLPRLSIVSSLVHAQRTAAAIEAKRQAQLKLFVLINQVNLRAFPQAVIKPQSCSVSDGYLMLMQSVGVGSLKPNLVLVGWQNENLLEIIRHARLTEKVIAVYKDLAPLDKKHGLSKQGSSLNPSASTQYLSRFQRGSNEQLSSRRPLDYIDDTNSTGSEEYAPASPTYGALYFDQSQTNGTRHASSDSATTIEDGEHKDSGSGDQLPPQPSSPTSTPDRSNSAISEWDFSAPALSNATHKNLTSVPEDIDEDDYTDTSNSDVDDDDDDDEDVFAEDEILALDTMEDVDTIYNKWERRKHAKIKARTGFIDIWWIIKNGGLPVLLGRLLTTHRVYRRCKLRVFAVVEGVRVSDILTANAAIMVERMLQAMRIQAVVEVIQVSPKTNAVVRTTILDEGHTEVLDSEDPDNTYYHGDTSPATMQVILEGDDFDEDDDRPFRPSHKSYRPSIMEIFPTEFSDGDEKERRLRKAQAIRTAALELYHSLLVEHSQESQLVILNLPHPPKGTTPKEYHDTLASLTNSIQRVLFVHSSLDDSQLSEQFVH